MLGTHDLPVFLVTAIALNLLPGPDTIYIVARTIAQGRSAGIASVLGISSGSIIHAGAAALGLSAILASSAAAFSIMKWLGAIYLIYIGLGLVFQKKAAQHTETSIAVASLGKIYRQALLTNMLNPKVALFFLALLPQFVDPMAPSREVALLFLGGVFVTTGTIWCSVVVFAAASVAHTVHTRPRLLTVANRLAGGIFIGLGIKLATQRTS